MNAPDAKGNGERKSSMLCEGDLISCAEKGVKLEPGIPSSNPTIRARWHSSTHLLPSISWPDRPYLWMVWHAFLLEARRRMKESGM